jgi:hypothetical protein
MSEEPQMPIAGRFIAGGNDRQPGTSLCSRRRLPGIEEVLAPVPVEDWVFMRGGLIEGRDPRRGA